MAKNGEDGNGRIGAVKDRVQFLNPVTKHWTKVDRGTRRIMDVKSDGTRFKGVTKEECES